MIKAKYKEGKFKSGAFVNIKGDEGDLLLEFRAICLSMLRDGFDAEELITNIELAEEIRKLCEEK